MLIIRLKTIIAVIALCIVGGLSKESLMQEVGDNGYSISDTDIIQIYTTQLQLIEFKDSYLIEIRRSAGPSLSLKWVQYYDPVNHLYSEDFSYPLAMQNGMIAYAQQDRVIIQDIFDKDDFYLEISEFQEAFPKMIDPFQGAVFDTELSTIEITYLAGEDYHAVQEVFGLMLP